jgi:hypothetical protein
MFVQSQPTSGSQPKAPEVRKLGMRSPFVLAKIGYDMRHEYDDLIEQPLPEDISQAVKRLPQEPILQVVSNTQPATMKSEPEKEAGPDAAGHHPWWRFW